VDHLKQDIRYALRGLRNAPAFTAAVVLTLALGLGANAAMFGVADQLMFRPLAYLRDPARVDRVYLRMPGRQRLLARESFPYARYLDLQRWTTSFSQSAAFFPVTVAVGSGEAARERSIVAVSASFFDFFSARPVLGRFFTAPEDALPAGTNVAVLSYDFWKSELGGRNVIGQRLQVDNIDCSIIGVAPRGFSGVDGSPPSVFIPITTFGAHQGGGSSVEYWRRYTWDWAEMIVRRKPGVTRDQASADLTQAFIRSRDQARAIHAWMPQTDPVRPLAIAGALKNGAGPYPGMEARTLLWVAGVAFIVFLVACANVANLFFARALRRRREVALRVALGVTRRRLIAQASVESLVLSTLACAVGIAIAQWGGVVLGRLYMPEGVAMDVVTDWRTLSVALVTAIAAGLIAALAPVLFAERQDLSRMLTAGLRDSVHRRSLVRSTLLVAQGALSVALLVGAGLFVRSLKNLNDERLGYDVDPVLLVRWERRGAVMSVDERAALRRRLLDVVHAIPGVERAAWVSNVPLQGTSTMSLFVPGIDSVARLGRFTYQSATADYFAAAGTHIVRGRAFSTADAAGAPTVAVISEQMARVLWPDKDAIGQCMRVGADTMPCTSVVGIAEDAVHDPIEDQPLRYYLPMDQFPTEGGSLLVVRVQRAPSAMAESVRRRLQSAMPGQQYVTTAPMSAMLSAQRRSWHLGTTMFVAFGALALIVAAVGLYGVIGYDVAQRRRELGVRVALGAQWTSIVRLVVGQSVRFAAAGFGVGGIVAWLGGRWVEPLLFHESSSDPTVFAVVAIVMVAVAVVASASPALRAATTDPGIVLRTE
jgi:predicted permease